MTADWVSYDAIADEYADVSEPHYFARPAADLVALLAPRRGSRFLDAGAGSGAVARCARDAVKPDGVVVALDTSIQMLRRCDVRRRILASLLMLPLREQQFDCASAAFVISHIARPELAVGALASVLHTGGRVGMTSWAGSPASSPPGEIFQRVVLQFAAAEQLGVATKRVLPSEERFAVLEELAKLFHTPSFADIHTETRRFEIAISTSAYVESRLLGAAPRYLKARLSASQWDRFRQRARDELFQRFGDMLSFPVSVNFVIARKA